MASNFCLCVSHGLWSRGRLSSTLSWMPSSCQGNFLFSVSVKQTSEINGKKNYFCAQNKVKVTLMRWFKPLVPRTFIDWKLRLHPSATGHFPGGSSLCWGWRHQCQETGYHRAQLWGLPLSSLWLFLWSYDFPSFCFLFLTLFFLFL